MEEILLKIETEDEASELFEEISQMNSKKYNQTKAAEELNELSLVLLQFANKKGDCLPDIQELYDEFGDVLIRLEMVMNSMDLDPERIKARILHKANKYAKWIGDKAYSEI